MNFKYVLEFKVDHKCKLKNVDKYLHSDMNMIYEFLVKNDIRDSSNFTIKRFIGDLEV